MHDHGVPWKFSADPLHTSEVQYKGENGHDPDDFSDEFRDLQRLLRNCDFAALASVPQEAVDRDRRCRVGSCLCSICTVDGGDSSLFVLPIVIQVAPLLFEGCEASEWIGLSIMAFCQSPDVTRHSERYQCTGSFSIALISHVRTSCCSESIHPSIHLSLSLVFKILNDTTQATPLNTYTCHT